MNEIINNTQTFIELILSNNNNNNNNNNLTSNNHNNGNSMKISDLTFSNGLLMIVITLLSVVFLLGLMKWSTSYYNQIILENQRNEINENFQNDFNDYDSSSNHNYGNNGDESDNEQHDSDLHLPKTTSNIVKSHLMNLQGKKKSHDGIEFIKVKNYDSSHGNNKDNNNNNIFSNQHLRGQSV